MSIENPHPHHAAHLSWGAAGATLVLTLAYHYFLAGRYYGFGLAVFVLILVIAMHGMAVLSGRSGNSWAYVFLLPALLGIVAEVMYANPVVRVAAPLLIALSIAFFSYWLMAPKITMREVRGLWPQSFFLEAVIPAEGGSGMFNSFSFGKHWKKLLLGFVFAAPFLFVFGGLFASADPLFRKTLSEFFHLQSLPELFWKAVRDVAVAFFLGRYLWSMLSRAIQQRKPQFVEWQMPVDRVVVYTFLGLLNALFLLFIGFQFVYFFGGHDLIQQLGITYADYAHEGFFQLLAVSALVFGISWFIYLQTEMKQWGTRGLAFALIAQTGIVIASAVRRLLLYVDAYGLTVLRLWALIGIFFIALILIILVVSALTKLSYGALAKITLVVSLYVFAGLLLVNAEAMTVNFNAARYLAHGKDRIDVAYFETLSSDAVPAMVAFQKAHGNEPLVAAEYSIIVSKPATIEDEVPLGYGIQAQQVEIHHFLDVLRSRRSTLQTFVDADWRNAVWSDRAALFALSSIQ